MLTESLTKLAKLKAPEKFSRANLGLLAEAALALRLPVSLASEAATVLDSSDIQNAALNDLLTLAVVKPEVDLAMTIPGTDAQLCSVLIDLVQPPLKPVFQISVRLTPPQVERFYGSDPRQRQSLLPPIDSRRYNGNHNNRWEEFVAWITHGPITFLILHSPQGNATNIWRDQIGNNWDIQKVKQKYPHSIRARFTRDDERHNNLLHGSDSPQSAAVEISALASILRDLSE